MSALDIIAWVFVAGLVIAACIILFRANGGGKP